MKCVFCDRIFITQQAKIAHEFRSHNSRGRKLKTGPKNKLGSFPSSCVLCKTEFTSVQALSSHTWKVHSHRGINHKPTLGKKKNIWNKGLNKFNDERIANLSNKLSLIMKDKIKRGEFSPPKMTEHQKIELSILQSTNNRGGKAKWFTTLDGRKVQGTWEFKISQKLDEFKIRWERGNCLYYYLDGKKKRYSPDFYLPEFDIYLEIKGYWWGNDIEKMKCVIDQNKNKRFVLVEKEDYEKCLNL